MRPFLSPWLVVGASLLTAIATPAFAASNSAAVTSASDAARSLAPTGRLRVAINLGNGVLAQRDATSGALTGVSVVLARALGERLNLPVDLTAYDAAGQVFDSLESGAWDVAFLAIEPERAAKIDFSQPYVYIDGTYLVRRDAPFRRVEDLDRKAVTIAVGRGAAYDLFLTRTLKNAELKRAPTSAAAVEMFKAGGADAAAGVRQALLDAARGRNDLRVLADRFTRIDQAMAVPRGRAAGAAYVRTFLEEMKASGRVRAALDATGQDGAVVAPP
jgi:polar amino acid transport system substrate-binding protein